MSRCLRTFLVCALVLLSAPAMAGAHTAHGHATGRGRHAHATHHKRRAHKKHHKRRSHKRRSHKTHRKHSGRSADLGQPCVGTDLMPAQGNLELIRTATLCLVNQERAQDGESPLQPNGRLEQAAQGHTESMAFGDYFEHDGPQGETPLSRMIAAGYIYSSRVGYEIGENIAWGTISLATPRAIVAAWMASPGHRENILDPNYRDTAIGVCTHLPSSLGEGQPGAIYTQDFGVIITG